jgi:hypothetical protein
LGALAAAFAGARGVAGFFLARTGRFFTIFESTTTTESADTPSPPSTIDRRESLRVMVLGAVGASAVATLATEADKAGSAT